MSLKFNKNIKVPDYFSDDDVEEPNNHDIMDDYPYDDNEEYNEDDYIDETDEETRKIIFNCTIKNNDRITNELNELYEKEKINKEAKSIKKMKKQQNKHEKKGNQILNLVEFHKKIEEEEHAKKPKRFVSKRADEKRKQLGIDEDTEPNRSFNPRKPPYNFVKSHDNHHITPEIFNTIDFPSL